MATYSKKSLLAHPRTSLSNLTAIYWNEFLIDIKTIDIIENPQTIADWLRYYRQLHNVSRRELELTTGITLNIVKSYEDKDVYPTRQVSEKLASYFNLSTKYFFDPMYEENIDIPTVLKMYRKNNNLTINEAAKIVPVSNTTWKSWEKSKNNITRKNYYILKEKGIL